MMWRDHRYDLPRTAGDQRQTVTDFVVLIVYVALMCAATVALHRCGVL